MKKNILSLVTIGLLLVNCGGGGSTAIEDVIDDTINPSSTTDGNSSNTAADDNNDTTNPTEGSSTTTPDDTTQETIDASIQVSPSSYSIPAISEADKVKFLEAVNDARATGRMCGDIFMPAANPLIWNDNLYKAAYEHNYDMINVGYFDHNGSATQYDLTGFPSSTKSTPLSRIQANGYMDGPGSYGVGENLAMGQTTIEGVVSQADANWIDSPAHCKNLMTAEFTEMAISKVKSPYDGLYYWTQTLGFKN